jgi:hypothetical protein
MPRILLAVAVVLVVATVAGAQDLRAGPLAKAAEREALRLAAQADGWVGGFVAPEFGPVGPARATPTGFRRALAAWSGVVLSALAGWPPAGPPVGLSRSEWTRVNAQHATIEGYFAERIAGVLFR